MFGFLKKLVTKPEISEKSALPSAPPAPQPVAVVQPAPKAVPPPAPIREAAPAPAPALPIQSHTSTATAGPSAFSGQPAPSGEQVEIPYPSLFTKLDAAIQQLAARPPAKTEVLRLPLDRIQPQLASGGVKITLAELREYSPQGVFQANGHDETQVVSLPLSELLPRLKPEQLGRRANQKKIEISPEIETIFGPGGGPLRVSREPARPAPAKSSAETIAEFKAKLAAQAAAKTSAPAPQAAAPIPIPEARVEAPIPAPPAPVRPTPPAPAASPAPAAIPISPIASAPAPIPATGLPEASPAPAIKAPNLDPALAGQKKQVKRYLEIAMGDLEHHWTEAGKQHLSGLYRHTVEIPMEIVELGLKRGKVAFPWSQFKGWIRMVAGAELPELPPAEEIDLPLAVIAPRFMEQHKPLRKQRQIAISDDIPDVFAPAGQPAAAPTVSEVPAAPAAVEAPQEPAAPRDELGELFGKPEKTNWSLQEIVQGCPGLKGIAGALLATPDGLLIASALPDGVKSETIAAFLPQLHGRVTQFSTQLNAGEASEFTLLLGQTPVGIYKTNNSYFIVLGRAGEALPHPQLATVALRLRQHTAH